MLRRLAAIALPLLVLGGLGWAALAPLGAVSREELFEIPPGTSARRIAGEKELAILPQTIRLGVNDVLAAVREAYGVSAEREGTGPDYAMAHTSSIFLIDRAGRLRAMMPFGHEAADFVHDVAILLEA